jgi:hypothetical protein
MFYDGDPHAPVEKERLWAGITAMGPELDRNVKYLEEKGLVHVKWFRVNEGFNASISSEGIDFLETGEPKGLAIVSPVTIQQEFHGPVGQVAGRDINIQISFTEVVNELAAALEADPKIPTEEKRSLVDKLKLLGENEWIRSIGTSVLAEVIKKSVGI